MNTVAVSTVLAILLSLTSSTQAFKWTNLTYDGRRLKACEGDEVNFVWTFHLDSGEQVKKVIIERLLTHAKHYEPVVYDNKAIPDREMLFFPDRRLTVGPGTSLTIAGATAHDEGTYTLTVRVTRGGKTEYENHTMTTLLGPVFASPKGGEEGVKAKVEPRAVKVVAGSKSDWHVMLSCGRFLSPGHPVRRIKWKTPEGGTLNSTSHANGTFFLTLPNPVSLGLYRCVIDPLLLMCAKDQDRWYRNLAVDVSEAEVKYLLSKARSKEMNNPENEMGTDSEDTEPEHAAVYAASVAKDNNCSVENCYVIKKCFPESGVRTLNLRGRRFRAYCDQTKNGGGWTVMQRRQDGSTNFYRSWQDYVNGFGDTAKEYWLGLENIYQMTKDKAVTLQVELEDFQGNKTNYEYTYFQLGSASTRYRLQISGYTGPDGQNGLWYHNNRPFGAYNHDPTPDCAFTYRTGWWFYVPGCVHANLNAPYEKFEKHPAFRMNWFSWTKSFHPLKRTVMKIRPNV